MAVLSMTGLVVCWDSVPDDSLWLSLEQAPKVYSPLAWYCDALLLCEPSFQDWFRLTVLYWMLKTVTRLNKFWFPEKQLCPLETCPTLCKQLSEEQQ